MLISLDKQQTTSTQGHLVASVLRGSWRKDPAPAELDSETLSEILPLLTTGVSGLVWRRIRGTMASDSPAARQLHDRYRYDVLRNAIHSLDLKEALAVLGAKGIESVLVKGCSLAPFYPEPGMRPFGDIDLCVRPSDYRSAALALQEETNGRLNVDLHCGFGKFYEKRTEELFARSRLQEVDGLQVRVLRFEDHFRFLCLHLLRHGGGRPLWLCDIAAALEALPDDFDWHMCLGDDHRQAELIAGAIGIANYLLAANIDRVPVADRARSLPSWMISTVMTEWGSPFSIPSQVASHLRNPVELLKEFPRHWPNPITATINRGGRLNKRPRWPLQIADVMAKSWGLLTGTRGASQGAI